MLLIILINCVLVSGAVLIHYETLNLLTLWLARVKKGTRFKIVLGIFGALFGHTLEIWFYAFAYYFMEQTDQFGLLIGNFSGSLLDCVYFSFSTYSSLGFGDILPTGNIRFVAGLEVLTGLVLISWTASFLFFEMQKIWGKG